MNGSVEFGRVKLMICLLQNKASILIWQTANSRAGIAARTFTFEARYPKSLFQTERTIPVDFGQSAGLP